MDVNECLSHPCKNNATCLDEINDYQCICSPGYSGKDCGTDIDECLSNPCSEGSTCIDSVANYKCKPLFIIYLSMISLFLFFLNIYRCLYTRYDGEKLRN